VSNKVDQLGTVIFRYTYDADNRLTNRWSTAMGKSKEIRGTVAKIEFVEPTKAIRRLRVSKPEYNLRSPVEIPNAAALLSQTNALDTILDHLVRQTKAP